MCRLLETLRVQNRRFLNIGYHSDRLNLSRRELFQCRDFSGLSAFLEVPADVGAERHRCRVVYDHVIRQTEFFPYQPRPVRSLRIVDTDAVDYVHKFENRSQLNALREERGDCDEILIAIRGWLTDTSYSNVAFGDSSGWYTPLTFLLNGTKRQQLVSDGILGTREIRMEDIPKYDRVCLINAMLDLGEVELPISAVVC